MDDDTQDAVVIGGGFYGVAIAIYLARERCIKRVLLVEREPALLTRASYHNQARIHNGYHYPRSFTTAYRSRINVPKFVHDWPNAVKRNFTSLYAIARRNSKVTATQFEYFCRNIGAKIQPAEPSIRRLFNLRLVESVFMVEEHVFDINQIARWAEVELPKNGVRVRFNARVSAISPGPNQQLLLEVRSKEGAVERITSPYVFNCTYSGINHVAGDALRTDTVLKQELTEIAMVMPPVALQGLGVTVMDGPFFSMMPFPARGLHTLSHVRYSPHFRWTDDPRIDPYQTLAHYDRATRVDRMIRDAARYLPDVLDSKYVDSHFEVKTVLAKNETDDGRPILFEKHTHLPGCYSILGGKIDNIYDAFEKLDEESFANSASKE
ncbi:MAG: FAD-dependent oxidoreductase [Lysobacter sp.]|nr:FAD-dependent oxidoreductase [Lysobacter sp.]